MLGAGRLAAQRSTVEQELDLVGGGVDLDVDELALVAGPAPAGDHVGEASTGCGGGWVAARARDAARRCRDRVRRPKTISRRYDCGRRWPVMSMSPHHAVRHGNSPWNGLRLGVGRRSRSARCPPRPGSPTRSR